ncbi:winged helix-turn-helix domain-containing protein [Citrobacter cronae]|uniref:winged helix-turn-helix domain-containing protein n=1 Tax=Citrobacter cronae TaxID=1748967 RepID=UPI0021D00009|nr:winged helix-turn-helix domain-containing protein [Citrobacter cronae]MCU6173805.1 winged helix-turn-helix domain-containing protein [Citrobacter cronae]
MVNKIMTRYTINNQYTYDDKTHEIKNIKSADGLIMTSMKVKCFKYMIQNSHQEVIHKRQLAEALWGDRCQFVNDANLTQLLYLLRKDLRECGLHNFFSTVPRQGVKVNADIIINKPEKGFWQRHNFYRKIILHSAFLILSVLTIVFSR